MGVLDNIKDGVNKGIASTGRATRTLQLKAQIGELDKKRDGLMTQLGASLYDDLRTDAQLRAPREVLFSAVEALDAEAEAVLAEIAAIESAAERAALERAQLGLAAAWPGMCPQCGTEVAAGMLFCTGCGADVSAIPQGGSFCPQCGSAVNPGAQFCTGCGASVPTVDQGALVCVNCGGPLRPGAQFCISCGTPVA